MEKTTITINQDTWLGLLNRKKAPSDTFDDIIKRMMLECPEEKNEAV